MNRKPDSSERTNVARHASPPPIRRGTWVLICMVALTTVALIGLNLRNRSTEQSPSDSTAQDSLANPDAAPHLDDRPQDQAVLPPASARPTTDTPPRGPAQTTLRQPAAAAPLNTWTGSAPSMEARALVTRLVPLDQASGHPDAARAAEWKQDLQLLVQQGDAGVAAVRELLTSGTHYDLGDWGRMNLGYASPRLALLDVLGQSGTADARMALADVLQSTLDPAELGTALRHLETLAPGQYREQALQAARQALAAAEQGGLSDRDMAPAFEILQKFGGPDAVTELDRLSGKYLYYSAMALSQLSADAGLPLLISMAQGDGNRSAGDKLVAQQLLASLAPDHPTALAALLDDVRSDRIGPNGWAFLTMALEGRKFSYENGALDLQPSPASHLDPYHTHLETGNQRYYQALDPAAYTPEWKDRQLAMIEQLLAATQNAAAVEQLQRVRDGIHARQPPVSATGP